MGRVEEHAKVFKPTVGDVANDVKIGSVDAGIVWDATARQYPELEAVHLPLFDTAEETITVGVLNVSQQPREALRLARYLGARDRGLKHFARLGYEPVDGDPWAETPEIVLYSGAVNRVAVEDTIRQFEEREGARVTRVYNGCGILVGQMKAGGRPDAYLTCDRSFVPPVAELFVGRAGRNVANRDSDPGCQGQSQRDPLAGRPRQERPARGRDQSAAEHARGADQAIARSSREFTTQ